MKFLLQIGNTLIHVEADRRKSIDERLDLLTRAFVLLALEVVPEADLAHLTAHLQRSSSLQEPPREWQRQAQHRRGS